MNASRFNDAMNAYSEALAIHKALQSPMISIALIMRANLGISRFAMAASRKLKWSCGTRSRNSVRWPGIPPPWLRPWATTERSLSVRGRHEDAITTLRSSVRMAVQFTGAASPLAVLNRLFLAEALMAAGQNDAADNARREYGARSRAKLGADHMMVLRTQLDQARLADVRSGHPRASCRRHRAADSRPCGRLARPPGRCSRRHSSRGVRRCSRCTESAEAGAAARGGVRIA